MIDGHNGRRLGLIGGLGPGATIHYYRLLIKAHAARGCAPDLLIAHADVSRVMRDVGDGNLAGLAEYLSGFTRQLADAGAEFVALTGITPHICASELVKASALPLIDAVDEVASCISAGGMDRVGLIGTRFVMETRMFGRLKDVGVAIPSREDLDEVHAIYLHIVKQESATPEQVRRLREIGGMLCRGGGAQAVVLGGTELSLVIDDADSDFALIDCARVHVDAIMRRLFDEDTRKS